MADHAPGAMREQKFEDYFGRKIAIDASMHIYQFLVSLQASLPSLRRSGAAGVEAVVPTVVFMAGRQGAC